MCALLRLTYCTFTTVIVLFQFCFGITLAAEDVVLQRTEPDPSSQQFPCPGQRVEYECRFLISTISLTWRLPSGETLPEFTGGSSDGTVRNSSDEQYSATLTGKMEDDDPNSDNLFFNSTLLMLNPTNISTVTCLGTIRTDEIQENSTVIHSGSPDPPMDVTHDMVVIESSVDMQWRRPSYTGSRGVSVINYTVSANGQTVVVSDDSEVVRYTSPGLIYGEVLVTAINSCGLQSASATHNIPTEKPPKPANVTVEMNCDDPLQDGRIMKINWEAGSREAGVVYPGEERVSVELVPGNIACQDVTATDTSCSVAIEKDDQYIVNISLANEIGVTINDNFTFNSTPVIVVDVQHLEKGLNVVLSVQELCQKTSYTLAVCFGREKASGCDFTGGVLLKQDGVLPGDSHTFIANDSILTLSAGDRYCYKGSLNTVDCEVQAPPGGTGGSPALGGVTGILISIMVVMIVLIVAVLVTIHLCFRHKRRKAVLTYYTESETEYSGRYDVVRTKEQQQTRNVLFALAEEEMEMEAAEESTTGAAVDTFSREPTPPPLPPQYSPSIAVECLNPLHATTITLSPTHPPFLISLETTEQQDPIQLVEASKQKALESETPGDVVGEDTQLTDSSCLQSESNTAPKVAEEKLEARVTPPPSSQRESPVNHPSQSAPQASVPQCTGTREAESTISYTVVDIKKREDLPPPLVSSADIVVYAEIQDPET